MHERLKNTAVITELVFFAVSYAVPFLQLPRPWQDAQKQAPTPDSKRFKIAQILDKGGVKR